ncbi:MAG: NAD-dependent epimerase/dehydratase family protein [Solirubrobacteraceae bacterium]
MISERDPTRRSRGRASRAEERRRRAVLAGTCAAYAWTTPVLAEASALRPTTLYSAAKHATHTVAASLAAQDDWELAWARLFFLYGEGDPGPRLIPSVAHALAEGVPAQTSSGEQRRDFLHVADAGAALAALAAADGVTGPVNVGSGVAPQVRDVAQRLADLAGRPELLRLGARPGGDEPA